MCNLLLEEPTPPPPRRGFDPSNGSRFPSWEGGGVGKNASSARYLQKVAHRVGGTNMEELLELKRYVEQKDYAAAFTLIGEMEEMSKDDKIHKVYSVVVILLLHLIKKAAEQRTTRSWEFSIRNAVKEINYINKRRKAGGYYIAAEELTEIINDAYPTALERAAMEAFEGQYTDDQLGAKLDHAQITQQAYQLISGDEKII